MFNVMLNGYVCFCFVLMFSPSCVFYVMSIVYVNYVVMLYHLMFI